MPLYTYVCVDCMHEFESLEKMNADPPPCPKCGEETEKKLTTTRLQFKEPWRKLGQRFK